MIISLVRTLETTLITNHLLSKFLVFYAISLTRFSLVSLFFIPKYLMETYLFQPPTTSNWLYSVLFLFFFFIGLPI